jgi:YidC/Oxa1 family membrane protein insertase
MDKNTITGIILIFLIFIGFSIFNTSRTNKEFEKVVAVAETEYLKGNYESARDEYTNALRIKPNQPQALARINEINLKLGNTPEKQKSDSLNATQPNSLVPGTNLTAPSTDVSQYGVFAQDATGGNDFITLENNKIELKISLKGGRVYSARLKDYKTFDGKPLVLFSGDSTIFGLTFLPSITKQFRQITFSSSLLPM